ncbi:hypothetical protein NEIRO03_2569 [Nematocida sp. AWRm78]|nr:hypothetical protein NEIRO03_2569 [Nematocida sp. AWRm78]
MKYKLGGRESRKTKILINTAKEKENIKKQEIQNENKEFLLKNKNTVIITIFLIICIILNLDINISKNAIFPFKLFSISLMKYGILAYLNIFTVIITLSLSLVHKIFIENGYFKQKGLEMTDSFFNLTDKILENNLNDVENVDKIPISYQILNFVYKHAKPESLGAEAVKQMVYDTEKYLNGYFEKFRSILIWISLIFSCISLFMYLHFSIIGVKLVTDSITLPIASGFIYNLLLRIVPLMAIIYDRFTFIPTKGVIYYRNRTYFISLLGYFSVIFIINLMIKLSENFWIYSIFDNLKILTVLINLISGTFTVIILFSVIYMINKALKNKLLQIYEDIMRNGIESYCDNIISIINIILAIITIITITLIIYKIIVILLLNISVNTVNTVNI